MRPRGLPSFLPMFRVYSERKFVYIRGFNKWHQASHATATEDAATPTQGLKNCAPKRIVPVKSNPKRKEGGEREKEEGRIGEEAWEKEDG